MMTHLLDLALHAAQLKRMPRTGWQIRGAPLGGQPENVAAHSYGVVFLTMLLLDLDERDLARDLALRMAILHDLAESLIGDLPKTISRFISVEVKHAAEEAAMEEIIGQTPMAKAYRALWKQYEAGTTAEALLVKDADKLDMMLQAYLYEQAGQRNLGEFWRNITSASFIRLVPAPSLQNCWLDEGKGNAARFGGVGKCLRFGQFRRVPESKAI